MMVRIAWVVTTIFLATCGVAAAETLSCSSDKQFEGGGFQGHELKVAMKGGKITELWYSNIFSDGQEGGAYFCELGLVDGTPNSKWMRSGDTIRIIDKEPGDDSYAEIDILPGGDLMVSFAHVSHYHCGFGAEFPLSVVLKKSNGKCVVEMP